jgi:predicted anti-sigma-YlaC factor YlaD
MESDAHTRCRELLGPYVLGHLGPDEEAEVEAHLAVCASCADDAAEIAPLASRLPARGSAPRPGPSMAELEEQVVRVAARRRRRPRQLAATTAVVAVLGGVVALGQLGPEPSQGLGVREPVAAVVVDDGVAVDDAAVMPHTWGTEVFFTVEGLEDDVVYEVVLREVDGGEVPAGTLIGDSARPVVCVMNGAQLREDVTGFELRRVDDGRAVVQSELQPYVPEEA